MFNTKIEDDGALAAFKIAAADSTRVAGLTHRHYKYPARFSPKFVAAALESFSKPGDLVLDPYMGGGTAIVEALAHGRRAVGCDLNSLAVFVARAKTTSLTQFEELEVRTWATQVVPKLSYRDSNARLQEVLCEQRTRNLHLPRARPIKKFIALALISLDALSSENSRAFVRCALLNVSQWALNGRKQQVTLDAFRSRVIDTTGEMLGASLEFSEAQKSQGKVFKPVLIHDSAENIARHEPFKQGSLASLVITSPPYPGVHVLYHRWQVDGRRETPAPYWIANCLDGQGEMYYGFGSRQEKGDMDGYFMQSLRTLKGIRAVMKDGAVMVQMVAFSNPQTQLEQYLSNMNKAGFREIRTSTDQLTRAWRTVPGRSWHASLKGQTEGSREVALLHLAV